MTKYLKAVSIISALFLLMTAAVPKEVKARKYTDFKASPVAQAEITAERLNVRSGPGTEFRVLTTIPKGYVVDVFGEMADWFLVHLPDDSVGVISKQYVKSYKLHKPVEEMAEEQAVFANSDMSDINEIMALLNEERVNKGLEPLSIDENASNAARLKAEDMVKEGYFSHNSPVYGSPFNMLKQMGITYKSAGENIAGNKSLQGAHTQLINSLPHRANILNPRYNKLGLGTADSPKYGKILVELFIED